MLIRSEVKDKLSRLFRPQGWAAWEPRASAGLSSGVRPPADALGWRSRDPLGRTGRGPVVTGNAPKKVSQAGRDAGGPREALRRRGQFCGNGPDVGA